MYRAAVVRPTPARKVAWTRPSGSSDPPGFTADNDDARAKAALAKGE